jgi:hypothetical protein
LLNLYLDMSEPENRTDSAEDQSTEPQVPETTETMTSSDVSTVTEPATAEVVKSEAEVTTSAETEATETSVDTVGTPVTEAPAAAVAGASAMMQKFGIKKWHVTTLAVLLVVIILIALTYMMETQGRLQTGIFDGVNKYLSTKKVVATVNDGKVTQRDLDISVSQIGAGVALQGVDVADPEIKEKIRLQAIDMLINTELLKQEATARAIVITDEDVENRLEALRTDVGGEEVLQERMKEFNIDDKTLRRDIRSELTIKALLDAVFTEKNIAVSDKEITDMYEAAGGAGADLPPLADVRAEIEAQIRTTKEQEIVTAFVKELRDKATVEVL